MANRTYDQDSFQLVKRRVTLFAAMTVSEAATPVPTLNRWVYPTFGVGVNARTYVAAATAAALPSGAAYPLQYRAGAEGVLSVARTAIGKYTFTFQDRYQRCLFADGQANVASGTPVFAKVTRNTTITSMATATGSIIGVAFWDFAAAAVDPIGDVEMIFEFADATES